MRLPTAVVLALCSACADPDDGVAPADDASSGADLDTATDTAADTAVADTADDGPDTADTAGDTADVPDDYVIDEPEDLGNLLGPDEVAAALEQAFVDFFELDPFLVLAAVDAAVEADDATCPYHYTDYEEAYGYDYWYGDCSTADGSDFSGYLYGIHYEPFGSYGYWYPDYGWWYGDMAIARADGQSFELSGYWSMYQQVYGAQHTVYAYAYGEPAWEGAEYGDTWLGAGVSASFTVSGTWSPSTDAALTLDGGASGLDGVGNSIWFDGVYVASDGQGSDCPIEPSGTISLRDDAGDWYDVDFQGPAYAGASTFPAECDGCGDVWYQGQNLGQACIDVSALTGWEDSPW